MPFLAWYHTVPRDLHEEYANVILQSGAIYNINRICSHRSVDAYRITKFNYLILMLSYQEHLDY